MDVLKYYFEVLKTKGKILFHHQQKIGTVINTKR